LAKTPTWWKRQLGENANFDENGNLAKTPTSVKTPTWWKRQLELERHLEQPPAAVVGAALAVDLLAGDLESIL
jgi:hypothetical protein